MRNLPEKLNSEDIDILKEVGNICVGNTSGILSQLLGGSVDISIPGLDILSVSDMSEYIREKGQLVYGVSAQITSQLQGTIFLLFPEKDALKIVEKFDREYNPEGLHSIQFAISIIKEIGGIAIFSYLNTLSSLLKKLILSSVPNFLSGTADELLNMILREYEYWGNICVVHTAFREQSLNVEGSFYLILNSASTKNILDIMKNTGT